MRKLAIVVVLTGSCLLQPPAAEAEEPRCRSDDISVRLRLNEERYSSDEPVRMRMRVKNTSGRRCTMVWNSGNRADFHIFRDGEEVWSSSHCKAYTQAIVEESWAAGHIEVYRGRWRQWLNGTNENEGCFRGGGRAEAGSYAARGLFRGAGEKWSERVFFRITR